MNITLTILADWPTIPQLYVRGEFVGGFEIIFESFKDGELKQILRLGDKDATEKDKD